MYNQSRRLAQAAFLLSTLQITTATLLLGELQPIAGFPSKCQAAYNSPISVCPSAASFTDAQSTIGCDRTCFVALNDASVAIQQACQSAAAYGDTIISHAFKGDLSVFLCGNEFAAGSNGVTASNVGTPTSSPNTASRTPAMSTPSATASSASSSTSLSQSVSTDSQTSSTTPVTSTSDSSTTSSVQPTTILTKPTSSASKTASAGSTSSTPFDSTPFDQGTPDSGAMSNVKSFTTSITAILSTAVIGFAFLYI